MPRHIYTNVHILALNPTYVLTFYLALHSIHSGLFSDILPGILSDICFGKFLKAHLQTLSSAS